METKWTDPGDKTGLYGKFLKDISNCRLSTVYVHLFPVEQMQKYRVQDFFG
jgi:hypothetical protein